MSECMDAWMHGCHCIQQRATVAAAAIWSPFKRNDQSGSGGSNSRRAAPFKLCIHITSVAMKKYEKHICCIFNIMTCNFILNFIVLWDKLFPNIRSYFVILFVFPSGGLLLTPAAWCWRLLDKITTNLITHLCSSQVKLVYVLDPMIFGCTLCTL